MGELTLPKGKEETVLTKEFSQLIQELTNTIENHLQFVEDDKETDVTWTNLKCNGIMETEFQTVDDVAHMLAITDRNDMTMGKVITTFFDTLPVLKHYFEITKVNKKSIKIRRIVIKDMKKLFEDIQHRNKFINAPTTPAPKVQPTLTQLFSKSVDKRTREKAPEIIPNQPVNLE